MTTYSTTYVYLLSASQNGTWTIAQGNQINYSIVDATNDATISGSLAIYRQGVTTPYTGTYVGSYQSGVVSNITGQGAYWFGNTPMTFGTVFPVNPAPFLTCFARGTLIETESGPRAIEHIAVGDLIRTRDNGLQPIRWIGSRKLSPFDLIGNPKLRPIRISKDALGPGCPAEDLVVSPQHRILLRCDVIDQMFGAAEILVPAKKLLEAKGVNIAFDLDEVEYFHILFDRHEVVFSNGAETESLYTGREALKSVSEDARHEIFALFPELADQDYLPSPARSFPKGRELKAILSSLAHVSEKQIGLGV